MDGYSLLHRDARLRPSSPQDLPSARQRLVRLLEEAAGDLADRVTIVFDGQIGGLRHFKEDVREVQKGLECGIKIEGFDDVRVGDQIETYRIEEVARKLA